MMDVNYYKRLVKAKVVEIRLLREKIKKLELELCQAKEAKQWEK